MNTYDPTEEENKPLPLPVEEPLPLESLAPQPPPRNTGHELEKRRYWDKLLTGDPASVPAELRRQAGADDAALPAEERDYRLVSAINRSWMVDHKGESREKVRSAWAELRRLQAQELGVRDDEHELYAALSVQNEEAPRREQAARLLHRHYEAALQGTRPPVPARETAGAPAPAREAADTEISSGASALGEQAREQYLPLAEELAAGWGALLALEQPPLEPSPGNPSSWSALFRGVPALWRAVDTLAGMEPDERAQAYMVARSLPAVKALERGPLTLPEAVHQGLRRGADDVRHALVLGAGHMGTALTHTAGEALDSPTLRGAAELADKRLQVLDELRRVAQGEVFPIRLEDEGNYAARLAVELAGVAPRASLVFMGGAGFGALTVAGTGEAVAEARRRSPQGRQALQTAAGILGGALQAAIFAGMSRVGAHMLQRSLTAMSQAGGARAYSVASLKLWASLTADSAKLLLSGKAAELAELATQELAARVDGVASNIDWQSYGDNFKDIETTMRHAAMNLPFVLLASGRVGLHHFRSRDAVLGDGSSLADWGVSEPTRRRIMETADVFAQSDLLTRSLRASRRWSAPGSPAEWLRSLRLLNTADLRVFSNEAQVAEFMQLRADAPGSTRPPFKPSEPSQIENPPVRSTLTPEERRKVDFTRLWDEWYQRANGAARRQEGENARRNRYYLDLRRNPSVAVPEEMRTGNYYQARREEMVSALAADRMSELMGLSYEMLMNMESLDSLRNSYANSEEARRAGERNRRNVMSHLMLAVQRSALGETSPAEAFGKFSEYVENLYRHLRSNRRHIARWLRKISPADLKDMYVKACRKALRFNKRDEPKLLDAYRIMLGMRHCAESLIDLLPHTDRFQALLNNGASPGAAIMKIFRQELREHIDESVCPPVDIPRRTVQAPPEAVIGSYRAISGHDFESSPDGRGGLLWRLKRPDDRYTFWYADKAGAVNELVGNVQLMFLPQGQMNLAEMMRQGGSLRGRPQGIYRAHLLPQSGDRLTGFENLGNEATGALSALWLGRATHYGLGLELSPDFRNWLRQPGRSLDYYKFKQSESPARSHVVQQPHLYTPMHLAQSRFLVYWNRLLSSGWVSPQAAGELLVQAGMLTRPELDDILKLGQPRPIDFNRYPLPERRRLRKLHPDGIRQGDPEAMWHELSRRLAGLNAAHMLVNLPDSGLPHPVRQWFSMAPFTFGLEETTASGLPQMPLRMNRGTAEQFRALVPLVNALRLRKKAGETLPLEHELRAAYCPDSASRCEQGWCFALAGEGAFRGAGQEFWNLLHDPARARSLMPPEEQARLDDSIRPHCSGREPAEALQELSELLRRYPAMHSYGMPDRRSNELCRMKLDAAPESGLESPSFFSLPRERTLQPEWVEKGFTLEPAAELPPGMKEDARVLPALHLLGGLRLLAADAPYADAQGILWRNERYGGPQGRRPGLLDDDWQPEAGLQPLLDFYYRAAGAPGPRGADGRLEVCGVSLGGLRPGDVRPELLEHITIYRNREFPDQMVRLMPGRPDAANPRQTAPYVVHTSDGAPLFSQSMARRTEQLPQILHPLNRFRGNVDRSYSFEVTAKVREMQMDELMQELLEHRAADPQSWAESNGRRISNLELFMQIFQDGRLSGELAAKEPAKLTRGEALAAELARLVLLAECGTHPAEHIAGLVDFAARLRGNPVDMKLLRLTLRRVVSPFPAEYAPGELNPRLIEEELRTLEQDAQQD